MSEPLEATIKYFRSNQNFTPMEPYLPGAEAGQIWLALHQKQRDAFDPCSPESDQLTKDERKLYDAITSRLSADLAFLGYTITETPPPES